MDAKGTTLPIAVIGMGCRYPGADSPRQLWANVLSRRRQFRRIPKCRLPLEEYHHEDRREADRTYLRMAAVIDGFTFDWVSRRIPRSTYLATDVVHWLALETALQAVADAGYTVETFPGPRTGVIVGNSLTGEQSRSSTLRLRWPYVRKAFLAAARRSPLAAEEAGGLEKVLETYYKSAFPEVNEDTLAGGLSNTIAGRICNYLNLDGGGYTVDGACSSSLLAIATAASVLSAGDLDLALAGGVDISLDPFELVGFARTGALTSGEMTVYDRRASGFIPGEGCGFVVLKRYEDALRDGNDVYAVLRGWGISSDGGNASITAPSVPGQAEALRRAYAKAGYGAEQLRFIEGHGTGTAVGDRVEVEAIASLFTDLPLQRPPGRFCGITSLKSIIGHAKAAAGVGGFIKAVMAVNRRVCPPTAGCRTPNRVFEESAKRLFPVLMGKRFPPDETVRAGVSAMGFGGINSHVTIESAGGPSCRFDPEMDERALMVSSQDDEVFVLTADDESDLGAKCRALAVTVEGISYAELTDLAAGLGQKTDSRHRLRAAVVAGSPDELAGKLRRLHVILETGPLNPGRVYREESEHLWLGHPGKRPRVAFLFPGQGSQKLNMARFLVERFPWARELVERADLISGEFKTTPLSQIMFPPIDQAADAGQFESWFHELTLTANAQPAICLASVLWCRFLRELGITPAVVGGHSLGEATAFYAAGGFDETTLLRFAFTRGRAMTLPQEIAGAMLGLRCNRRQAEGLLGRISDGYVALANINAPDQVVASGELSAIEQLSRLAREEGIAASRLPVSSAFHCRLTSHAAKKLEEEASLPTRLSKPSIRLLSCMDGREIPGGHDLKNHFVQQVTSQVDFTALVESAARGSDILVEVGPGRVLTGLVGAILQGGGPPCLPVESSPFQTTDLNRLLATLFVHGLDIHWNGLYANRLVYPFVAPADRSFIGNPCETPLDVETADPPDTQAGARGLTASLLPGLGDVPLTTLRSYLEKRGPFLADVVRADLKSMAPEQPVADVEMRPPSMIRPDTTDPKQDRQVDRSAEEILYGLVEEVTGFPKETLTPEARLLDDLNLDSIKSGELIARFAKHFNLSGELDPAEWTNASLGRIVDLIVHRRSDQSGAGHKDRLLDIAEVLRTLLDQTSQITGIPSGDIPIDAPVGAGLKLEADQLHLVLTATSKVLKRDLNLDLQPLLHRSLEQIAEIVVRIARSGEKGDLRPVLHLSNTWVRELRIDVIESERPPLPPWYGKRAEDQWPNARVLVLGDDPEDEVCHAMERHLSRLGARVLVKSFDSARSVEFRRTVDGFSHFIAVLPRTARVSDPSEDDVKHMVHRLSFAAAPPPASHGPRRRNCLGFVQFGGGFFGIRPDAPFLDQCCATALAKSVYLERDDLKTRVIDFDPGIGAKDIAEKTILEMQGPQDFAEVGYDHRLIRRTPVANAIEPAQYDRDPITWSSKDVILATGGAKGITAECAFALARTLGTGMALVGRTPIPDPGAAGPEGEKILEILRRYSDQGLQARYYSCDICDRRSLAETVRQIQREMGPITGVIHGAGRNSPRRFHQVPVEEALKEVAPKVIGALNLLSLLQEAPPKIIVGLTSSIGITGMQGNAWYAFSNEALDLILRRYGANHPTTRTLSVAYSIWRDEGMGARMGSVQVLKRQGIDAIPTKEGVKRFIRLFLRNPGTHQVLVAARMTQMDTLGTPAAPPVEGARFLEKRIHYIPGVESAFLVHLSLEEDLYLQDHCYNGSYLFPAVFGLEAMAQAVAHVTGVTGFRGVRVENLLLRRPIIVDPEKGADIIVWAQAEERAAAEDPLSVRAGIARVGVDSNPDFFSATFIMGSWDSPHRQPPELPAEPLDLDPPTDLYRNTFLFQGPRFQRFDRVHLLERSSDDSGVAVISVRPSEEDCARLAFAGPEHHALLLGDPFQRDNLLQSVTLLVPQEGALPLSVRRWDIYPRRMSGQVRMLVQTRLLGLQQDEIDTSVESFDPSGLPAETLDGFRLKVLKHHDEHPTTADLLHPDDRDTREVQKRISELAAGLRLRIPLVRVSHLPGLHEKTRQERREAELPLLNKAVEQWAERRNGNRSAVRIEWEPSGRPAAWIGDEAVGVSLAHDARYCIVAVGAAPLGCDLAPVLHRTLEQWHALLGPFGRALIEGNLAEEEIDRRGTALWAAREVLQKLNVKETLSIGLEKPSEDTLLFLCTTEKRVIKVLAFRAVFTLGGEGVVALSVGDSQASIMADDAQAVDYPGYESLFDRQHFRLIKGGPQGQAVFVHRFPVTFMPVGQLSRHVYYSHYFFWAGTVREASAWPVLGKIADQFSTGKWGGVTNFADLKILGEATTHDLVEVRMWSSGNGGPQNSVLDLTYDFRKVLPTGGYERLAWLEQKTTWVRILDHGVAKVEPYPDYYADFIDYMLPRYDGPNSPEPIAEPLQPLFEHGGEDDLYMAPPGPAVKPVLHSQWIETSLEEVNIVGNIYFANYYAWQGRVRDRYLYDLIPDHFRGTGEKGELICLNCRTDHLREAMPFERVEVRMALKALKTCRATLHFEYFKPGHDGSPVKLATGRQEVVWVQRDAQGRPVPHPFPSAVQAAFLGAVEAK
jgi:acyl transferase domain-containing protein/acyl-CoA thioesterase FadM/NAD(P)-dependent dehydrogenase (short-subunit alcohol dehydrogenase family)/acyl carrier protein